MPTLEGGLQAGALAGESGVGNDGHGATTANEALTVRQVEILRLLRDGVHPKEIAQALHIADSTARSHIRDAIERLGVHGALGAVHEAERRGLLGFRE